MSVYKPSQSPYFHYDFQFKGRRYSGSTGVSTQRKAEEVERRIREDAALGVTPQDRYTLDQAAGRWSVEVGRHKASWRQIQHRIAIVVRLIGPGTPIQDITTEVVSRAIERRRGETYARGFDVPPADGAPGRKAARYALSNDTVNSDIVKRLRPILNRARKTWGVKGLPEIDWASLALPEAVTEIRHFTEDYQRAWLEACGPTEQLALEMLFAYGLRFGELFFQPDAYMPDTPIGPALAVQKRKGKKPLLMPLRPAHARQIGARVGIARAGKQDSIWLERAKSGKLIAVSYGAMQGRLRAAAERAGVAHDRLIHSVRHHFGTDFLAATSDLALTQEAMGHADIKSTLVYAHALASGLRDAILSRNSPEAEAADGPLTLPTQARRRKRA